MSIESDLSKKIKLLKKECKEYILSLNKNEKLLKETKEEKNIYISIFPNWKEVNKQFKSNFEDINNNDNNDFELINYNPFEFIENLIEREKILEQTIYFQNEDINSLIKKIVDLTVNLNNCHDNGQSGK